MDSQDLIIQDIANRLERARFNFHAHVDTDREITWFTVDVDNANNRFKARNPIIAIYMPEPNKGPYAYRWIPGNAPWHRCNHEQIIEFIDSLK